MAEIHAIPSSPQASLSRRLRRLAWAAVSLLAVLFLAAGLGLLWLYHAEHASLPQLDGSLHIAGLSAPVTVARDAHGVPHIEAATQDDLFVAQGFVTAQDRLWQMDMFRRHANGELAEVLGPSMIEHDRTQRLLLIRKTAERVYQHLPADERRRIEDYARGVNAYIAQAETANDLPAEFRLLGYKPQPWTGVDCVSVGMMEVQSLDLRAATKLDRWRVAARLNNPELEKDLYPVGSWRDHPPTGLETDWSAPPPSQPRNGDDDEDSDSTEALLRSSPAAPASPADLAALGRPSCEGCALGSNEWVIAGRHTASGRPLLSNDMHLRPSEPNIWYMVALRAPGFDAAGVTLPGMPYIVAGHNEHVAWGFTVVMADVQDLYLEKLDGKGNYEGPDAQWYPLSVDRETIHVRFGKDVTVDVQSTGHGPLINAIAHEPRPIALKWNLYDPALDKIPLYAMNTAANWTEFSAALADWSWPAQNLVYADDQGHIAYHAIGKTPLRPAGLANTPIADRAREWQGYIPFGAMPNAFDPPSGFLATANSRVTTDQSPYPLTREWTDPYRIERIYKSLSGRDGLTPKDMLAVQTDIYSEVDQEIGQRLAYAIDQTPGADARLRKAADLMRSWDGRLTADSAAASIVTKTRAALWPLILKPKLGGEWKSYHWGESIFAEEEIIMHGPQAWLPSGYRDWNELLTDAVRQGMKQGHAPSSVESWRYGDWHVLDIEHPLAAYLPFIARLAGTGAQTLTGDTTTVKQSSQSVAPSQRFTMDWSNIDGSTENIVLGESSNPLSPYYRDQWSAWYGGTTFALPFTPQAMAAQTKHTLLLEP